MNKINLVLIHGWGNDSRTWRPLRAGLSEFAQLQEINLPGFGGVSVAEFSLGVVLESLAEQIPEGSWLVGWSLGAMLGVQLAARYPQKICGLIAIAANAKFVAADDYPAAMASAINRQFNAGFAADPQATLKLFTGLLVQGDVQERALLKQLRVLGAPAPNALWLQALELLSTLDNRRALADLKIPLLHLLGGNDALVPAAAGDSLRAINCTHHRTVFPAAAHALHWSQPAQVVQAICKFIQRSEAQTQIQLDKKRVAQSFSRAASSYDSVAGLQRDLGGQLLQKIPAQIKPQRVLDLGSGTGFFTAKLAAQFPQAQIIGLDIAQGMLEFSRKQQPQLDWLCGDAEQLPLASNTVDLIFSSLAVQWCSSLPKLMGEIARVLTPGGALVLATLGPRTLRELKAAWQQVDDFVHVNQFAALKQVTDAAEAAGLALSLSATAEPVLYYDKLSELTRELKSLGAHNVNAGQPQGLTGRLRIQQFKAAYEGLRRDQGLPATYEVFYLIAHKR